MFLPVARFEAKKRGFRDFLVFPIRWHFRCAGVTRQVEKSTRRAYQALMLVVLRHEQAHKLMSSVALSRLDVLGLSTDHRLLLCNGASCSVFRHGMCVPVESVSGSYFLSVLLARW